MGFVKRLVTGPAQANYNDPEKKLIKGTGATAAFKDPNYAANKAKVGGMADAINNRAATTIAQGPQEEFRAGQTDLVNALQSRVAGTAPTVAGLQLQQGLENNIRAGMATAASTRGQDYGSAMRGLGRGVMQAGAQTNADAALLRANEQVAAENTLNTVLNSARGQDIGLATNQAQLTVQEQQQKDSLVQQYVAMGLSIDQANQKAKQDLAVLKIQMAQGAAANVNAQDGALIGAVAAGGAALASSGAGGK